MFPLMLSFDVYIVRFFRWSLDKTPRRSNESTAENATTLNLKMSPRYSRLILKANVELKAAWLVC